MASTNLELNSSSTMQKKRRPNNEKADRDMAGAKSSNDVPEAIILRIMSFLTTRDAVRLSVSSKGWENLWLSTSKLEFHEFEFPMNLMSFVEWVLICRASDIEEFILRCNGSEPVRVYRAVSGAVRRNVQKLFLQLHSNESNILIITLPHRLFVCESLTELKLDISYRTLKLPSSISFPRLKVLSLYHITFPDEHTTQKLFSNCPLLEQLSLYCCNWINVRIVSICASKLWDLRIEERGLMHEYRCKVNVFAKNLKFFRRSGEFFCDFCFYGSPLLEQASWTGRARMSKQRELAYSFMPLLQGLSFKHLKVWSFFIEAFRYAEELLAAMPILKDLTHLEVHGGFVDLCDKAFQKLFQNSPSLETLCLDGITLSSNSLEEIDRIFNSVPAPSFLSSLKKIKIYWFQGNGRDLRAVKILSEKADALEKIELHLSKDKIWNTEMTAEIQQAVKRTTVSLYFVGLADFI